MPPRDSIHPAVTPEETKEATEIVKQTIANLNHQLRQTRLSYLRLCQELLREQQKLIDLLAQH